MGRIADKHSMLLVHHLNQFISVPEIRHLIQKGKETQSLERSGAKYALPAVIIYNPGFSYLLARSDHLSGLLVTSSRKLQKKNQ